MSLIYRSDVNTTGLYLAHSLYHKSCVIRCWRPSLGQIAEKSLGAASNRIDDREGIRFQLQASMAVAAVSVVRPPALLLPVRGALTAVPCTSRPYFCCGCVQLCNPCLADSSLRRAPHQDAAMLLSISFPQGCQPPAVLELVWPVMCKAPVRCRSDVGSVYCFHCQGTGGIGACHCCTTASCASHADGRIGGAQEKQILEQRQTFVPCTT